MERKERKIWCAPASQLQHFRNTDVLLRTGSTREGNVTSFLWEHPDMMSALEGGGGHGKADVVREVVRIF